MSLVVTSNIALEDKDIPSMIKPLRTIVTKWYIAPMKEDGISRSASLSTLQSSMKEAEVMQYGCYDSLGEAYEGAMEDARLVDYVIIFGSFHVLELVLKQCEARG